MQQQLKFAPRASLALALTQPESYLGGDPLGLCPEQLDTVIAYNLLVEVLQLQDLEPTCHHLLEHITTLDA